MGDEIGNRFFAADDFSTFRAKLDEETRLLEQLFRRGEFSGRGDVVGFELEAWLVDQDGNPSPSNHMFLSQLSNPLVVPELSAYNVELNGSPSALQGRVFSRLRDELDATLGACRQTAEKMGLGLVTIGILPTIGEGMLKPAFMSKVIRYQSINDRIMALRDGNPISLCIEGDTDLVASHSDVMLEAATTSFQIHLQCRPGMAVRDFNASLIASAPMVAVSANSPFLFGHSLWDETRIPLFEQAVDVGARYPPRVSFGRGYVQQSLFEIFEENRRDHPILVPAVRDQPASRFAHVRFHNGTLWRWNRPLIGFDFDGQVHVRIEHRVVPAGPTVRDCLANSAFYLGLVRGFGLEKSPPEASLPFEVARDNFYSAARYGLNARVRWRVAGRDTEVGVRSLIIDELLPIARRGLQSRDIPEPEIDEYLGIVASRAESAQNGAAWQRRWVGLNGPDLHALMRTYRSLQESGEPVHRWPL
ncbi:MAG: glutamate--cysteine ligase [Chromatiales bacterium]|jgi:gamma-glutamyl:cysteine ligase YbdK (ATP-grasp superfamily)|nr:MAG: glutamate--cysteine ligase [Chromatiales bacterium]